ncbi:helix-turn-helix domain-containing protein [Paenibacillus sp. YN15]|uniref:helix-turn-helix domain-containing protein n=1 Tax=Paenibacillus sp. YN15 TaxID=1742774 RepID=UPI0011BED89A|nr:helix-turn-helix transcriptional regulator [Paenibacillus sp. YN15]
MSEIMKKVGEGIRHYRKKRGWNQEELAHLAQVHESYVGKLERAEKVCSVDVMERVTAALGVSMVEFFSYIQPEGKKSAGTTLEEIVDRLRGRSEEEQRRVLKVIDAVLDDKLK